MQYAEKVALVPQHYLEDREYKRIQCLYSRSNYNRTIKQRMFRYFTANHTRRYIDVLPDLIHSYNHTFHRSIGMAPSQVGAHNEEVVRKRLYPDKKSSEKKSMEVRCRADGANNNAKNAVPKSIRGRAMVTRAVRRPQATAHDAGHLQPSGLRRRDYKREVVYRGTTESPKT